MYSPNVPSPHLINTPPATPAGSAFIVPAQAPQQVIAPTHMINAAPQQPAQMLAQQQQQPAVQIINPAPLQQQAVMPTIAGAPAAAKLTPKVARGPDDSNLIVNYIPVELTDEELSSLFGQHGKVTNCRIMRDAKGIGKGFGFVKFEDVDAAMKCIEEMNGHEVYGKRLRVNIARPDKGVQAHNHPHFKQVQAMKERRERQRRAKQQKQREEEMMKELQTQMEQQQKQQQQLMQQAVPQQMMQPVMIQPPVAPSFAQQPIYMPTMQLVPQPQALAHPPTVASVPVSAVPQFQQ